MINSRKIYYLSEMNLSDRHGGGLTLQRVLADDLDHFDHFIQLFQFQGNFPTHEKYADRELNLWKEMEPFVYPGMPSRLSLEYFRYQYKRFLGIPNPKYVYEDNRVAQYYRALSNKVSFRESVFFVVPQHAQSVSLTNFLYRQHSIHYAAWVMDDHLLKYDQDRGFHYPENFEVYFRTFLKNARLVLVISENMRNFYLERFGIDSIVLFGPADANDTLMTSNNPDGGIKLCYFGALWKWQEDAIEKLIGISDQLDATLDIYTYHEVNEGIRAHARVNVKQPVAARQVKSLMLQYDGVIIPFGFDDEVRALSELNISTKLSECLASGVLTVLVGPEYGAMTAFARKHQCAVILSDVNSTEQIQSFKESFQTGKRTAILKAANRTSRAFTSTAAMQKVWKAAWEKMFF